MSNRKYVYKETNAIGTIFQVLGILTWVFGLPLLGSAESWFMLIIIIASVFSAGLLFFGIGVIINLLQGIYAVLKNDGLESKTTIVQQTHMQVSDELQFSDELPDL